MEPFRGGPTVCNRAATPSTPMSGTHSEKSTNKITRCRASQGPAPASHPFWMPQFPHLGGAGKSCPRPAVQAAGRADEAPWFGPSQAGTGPKSRSRAGRPGGRADLLALPALTLGTESAAVTSPAARNGPSPVHQPEELPVTLWAHCMDEETEAREAVTCLTSVGGEGAMGREVHAFLV